LLVPSLSQSAIYSHWVRHNQVFFAILSNYTSKFALRIETLSLWGVYMSATIPKSLYTLEKLKALHLRDNEDGGGFRGTISTEIGNLVNLEELVLNGNPLLGGTIPTELGLCKNLSKLKCLVSLTRFPGLTFRFRGNKDSSYQFDGHNT
jgi:hypothetical protein